MRGKSLSITVLVLGFASLWFFREAGPAVRLGAATLGLIWIVKIAALLWQSADGARFHSRLGLLLFLFAWPGVSVEGFTSRSALPPQDTGGRFLESWIMFLTGAFALVAVSLLGKGESTAYNYLALASILLVLHLGLVQAIADGLRLLGFSPRTLFDRPFFASSLRDFWSTRWNRAFVDMNRIFLLNPLRDRMPHGLLVLTIFAVSGVLHELGISFADGVSWGKPLLYFVVQGAGMELERRKPLPKILVWAWLLLPVPLLFTPAFTNLFVGGLAQWIYSFIRGIGNGAGVRFGLIAGGLLQLLVLAASVQVPGKLRWRQELAKLEPLNRKVFWTYGGYVFSIIIFMAVASFILSGQTRTPAMLLWLVFIALFWWARVVIDLFYMDAGDWPKGPVFTIGHICLTTLFVSIAVTYSTVAVIAWGGVGA